MSDTTNRPAFITGSRAYGTPRQDSDVDLVLYLPNLQDRSLLAGFAWKRDGEENYGEGSSSVRYGQLNLILCRTEEEYDQWRRGTEALKLIAPVDRELAKHVFKSLRGEDYGSWRPGTEDQGGSDREGGSGATQSAGSTSQKDNVV